MKAPFYFKYVLIDNYEDMVAELQPYILKHIEGFKLGFHQMKPSLVLDNCPIFSQWINSNKLQLRIIGIIIVPPYTDNQTHIDYINNDFSSLALNMEIENCRIPKTKMFLTDSLPIIAYTPSKIEYWKYEDDAIFTQVEEFDLSQPVLFETQIPHQVCNQTNQRRVSISFRFYEDPEFNVGIPPTPTSL
jgi:hypothetical protein